MLKFLRRLLYRRYYFYNKEKKFIIFKINYIKRFNINFII